MRASSRSPARRRCARLVEKRHNPHSSDAPVAKPTTPRGRCLGATAVAAITKGAEPSALLYRTGRCGRRHQEPGRARPPRRECAVREPGRAAGRMQPATPTRCERAEPSRDHQQPVYDGWEPTCTGLWNDRLARIDLDGRTEVAAQRSDRPDTKSEAEPHHGESSCFQRRRRRQRQPQRCGERRADCHGQRQRDQDACPAIAVATTLALDALAYPDAQFQHRPRREGEIDHERHGAMGGIALAGPAPTLLLPCEGAARSPAPMY